MSGEIVGVSSISVDFPSCEALFRSFARDEIPEYLQARKSQKRE
jgi:hypothetical protein